MKKLILKYQLESRDQFEDCLSAEGFDFDAMYWQHDRVYVPRGYKENSNYPRLIMRTTLHAVDEPAEYSLILRRHIEDSGIDLVETTPVTDYINTVNIILQLGFRLAKEVSRRRETIELSDGTIIHLDVIDNLPGATYAKIERPLTDASVEKQREALERVATALIDQPRQVKQPYSEL